MSQQDLKKYFRENGALLLRTGIAPRRICYDATFNPSEYTQKLIQVTQFTEAFLANFREARRSSSISMEIAMFRMTHLKPVKIKCLSETINFDALEEARRCEEFCLKNLPTETTLYLQTEILQDKMGFSRSPKPPKPVTI